MSSWSFSTCQCWLNA